MHLPYIQVTRETWDYAQQLSGLLGIPFGDAFTAVCELWRWGLSLGPEDQAPTGVCESPRAERLMVAAMRLKGDAGELAAVLMDLGLVERLSSGVRVRGMNRYAKAWEKAEKERKRKAGWRQSKGQDADVTRTETGTSQPYVDGTGRGTSAGQDADVTRDVGGKTQTQTQTQIKKETPLPSEEGAARSPPPFELVPPPQEKPRRRSEAQEFWDWAEAERTRVTGLVKGPEPDPPKLNAWFKRALTECGTVERLASAFGRYVLKPTDDHWQRRGFPFAGFMADNVWRQYAPPREVA